MHSELLKCKSKLNKNSYLCQWIRLGFHLEWVLVHCCYYDNRLNTSNLVGYGDYYPSGVLGRMIVLVACALGPFLISATTFAINNAISFNIVEEKAHQKLLSEFSNESLRKSAAKVICSIFKISHLRNKNESPFIYIFWLRETILEFSRLRSLKIIQDLQSRPFTKLIYNLNRNLSIESDLLIDNIRVINSILELASYSDGKQMKINRDFDYLMNFVKRIKLLLNQMTVLPLPPDVILKIQDEESKAKIIIEEVGIFRSARKRSTMPGKQVEKKKSNLLDEKSFLDYIKKSPFRRKKIVLDSVLQFDIQDSADIVKNLANRSKHSRNTVENMKKINQNQYQRATLRTKSRNFGTQFVNDLRQYASKESLDEKDIRNPGLMTSEQSNTSFPKKSILRKISNTPESSDDEKISSFLH